MPAKVAANPPQAGARGSRRVVRAAPLSAQVEELIAGQLGSELQAGQQLPSEHELAAELGVSRATVRAALAGLARRGLITSRQGVGNFVSAGCQITNSLTDAVDFNQLIRHSGARPEVVFDRADIGRADAATASALAIRPNAAVLVAAKRFLASGTPVIYAVTTIATAVLGPALTERVAARPEGTEPLFAFFATSVGRPTDYQLSSLRAVRSDEVAYPGHTLPPGTAVIEMTEVGYTADNQPIWHSANWYAPDAIQFQLIRRRPPGPPAAKGTST